MTTTMILYRKVISAYGGKVKGSFEMMKLVAMENEDLSYNSEFFGAIKAPGFTNEQRVEIIESVYKAKSKRDSREPGEIMKIISSTDFSKEQRDHLIKLTYDNLTKDSYFGIVEIIKMLETDKTIKAVKKCSKELLVKHVLAPTNTKQKKSLKKKDQENGMKYSNKIKGTFCALFILSYIDKRK